MEDTGVVIWLGLWADVQPVSYFLVFKPLGTQIQYFALAGRQRRENGLRIIGFRLLIRRTEKIMYFGTKAFPGRIIFQQNMIFALQRNKTGIGNERSQLPAGLKRHHFIAGYMKDQ